MRRETLIGLKFNRLTIIADAPYQGVDRCVVCICDCGNEKIIRIGNIKSGHIKSCGCLRLERDSYDGQKNNMLTVLEETKMIGVIRYLMCICDCGNKKIIGLDVWKRGAVKSCGCLVKKMGYIIKRKQGR